jgi:hypothetical protein
MRCEDVKNRLADHVRGDLPTAEATALDQHLAACASCYDEALAAKELWRRLGDIPGDVPDRSAMRAAFDRMLESYREGFASAAPHAERLRLPAHGLWRWSVALQTGLAVAVFLVGVLTGRFGHRVVPTETMDLTAVHQELHDLREMLTLSLMQQPLATERLRGVSWSNQIDHPGNDIVSALVDALLHDPNVNVRLAAADALRRFSDRPVVRMGTVQALTGAPFPMLQVALIDFVVETRETSAVSALRQLVGNPAANEAVRTRAAWGLQRLGS